MTKFLFVPRPFICFGYGAYSSAREERREGDNIKIYNKNCGNRYEELELKRKM
jgi:hypothetical protein